MDNYGKENWQERYLFITSKHTHAHTHAHTHTLSLFLSSTILLRAQSLAQNTHSHIKPSNFAGYIKAVNIQVALWTFSQELLEHITCNFLLGLSLGLNKNKVVWISGKELNAHLIILIQSLIRP